MLNFLTGFREHVILKKEKRLQKMLTKELIDRIFTKKTRKKIQTKLVELISSSVRRLSSPNTRISPSSLGLLLRITSFYSSVNNEKRDLYNSYSRD